MKTSLLVLTLSFLMGHLSASSDCEEGSLIIDAPEVICEGIPFTLVANLSDFDTYTWSINGQELTGEEVEYSTFLEEEIMVELVATNAVCTLNAELQMPVTPQPSFTVIPEGYTICEPGEELEIGAVGLASWYLNGELVTTGDPVVLAESGMYTVVVENECGVVEFDVPVQIVDMPEEVNLTFDGTQLSVSPEGSNYVWFFDGLPVEMSENSTFTPTEAGEYWVRVYFDSSACYLDSEFLFVPVSIDEHLAEQIALFPNPAKDKVTILHPQGQWNVTLTDMNGKVLQQLENITGSQSELDLKDYAAGTYYVRMHSHDGNAVKKMVIDR